MGDIIHPFIVAAAYFLDDEFGQCVCSHPNNKEHACILGKNTILPFEIWHDIKGNALYGFIGPTITFVGLASIALAAFDLSVVQGPLVAIVGRSQNWI